MKIGRKIIGLKLTPKLLLTGTTLLIIPWLGLQTLNAMQQFLIDGQAQAQLLSARGIATLLHGRKDLFDEQNDDINSYAGIPLYPLSGRILLDAYSEDWESLGEHKLSFDSQGSTQFSLLLGQIDDTLYGLIEVTDNTPIYRHPGYLRLDHSDHIRLYLKDNHSIEQRYLLTFEGDGRISAYKMDAAWQLATPGTPQYSIQGQVRITSKGYIVEFALPVDFLDASHHLGIAVADVTDQGERSIDTLVRSFPSITQGQYNRLIVRSPETERILSGLAQTDSEIWILDSQLRVRATAGKLASAAQQASDENASNASDKALSTLLLNWLSGTSSAPLNDFKPAQTHSRDEQFLRHALSGEAQVIRRPSLDGNHLVVAAVQPIHDLDRQTVMGLVLLEQTTDAILNLQSRSIQRIALYSLLALVAVILVVLMFSSRLTWRIKRLGLDTQKASDEQGRMQLKTEFRGVYAADEIGELTRHIEHLLTRLERYQQFLMAIPRTLRHEINNPLNTVTTSLEHLEDEISESSYLDSARRGLHRITAIINSLSEAASLEEALSSEALTKLDLTHLLSSYVGNQSRQHKHEIKLQTPAQQISVLASDMHIEQLLDKLLDNAIDYSPPDKPVEITLTTSKTHSFLRILNHGPPIPEAEFKNLFQLFHSRRDNTHVAQPSEPSSQQCDDQHLGLGLYIARVICERHGGDLVAENIPPEDGVVFTVSMPLAR